MKIETIWLSYHGHIHIFSVDEDIPNTSDYKIVKIIFDDGSTATW